MGCEQAKGPLTRRTQRTIRVKLSSLRTEVDKTKLSRFVSAVCRGSQSLGYQSKAVLF